MTSLAGSLQTAWLLIPASLVLWDFLSKWLFSSSPGISFHKVGMIKQTNKWKLASWKGVKITKATCRWLLAS